MVVIVLAVLIVVFALPSFWYMSTYNRLMALDARCDTGFADIDAHLKHRQNLIPALVDVVRGFTGHENEMITKVSEAFATAARATGTDNRLEAEAKLGQSVNTVLTAAQQFPELQSSAHFHKLTAELTDCENRITASRRFYNLAIEEYNATLKQFPGSSIASMRRLSTRRPFDLGVERVIYDEAMSIKL